MACFDVHRRFGSQIARRRRPEPIKLSPDPPCRITSTAEPTGMCFTPHATVICGLVVPTKLPGDIRSHGASSLRRIRSDRKRFLLLRKLWMVEYGARRLLK